MKNRKAYITHNNEAGPEWYSICFYNDPGNWLESFTALEEAEEYCWARDIEYDRANDLREDIPYADMG